MRIKKKSEDKTSTIPSLYKNNGKINDSFESKNWDIESRNNFMVPNNKRERREHLSLDLKKRLATGHGSKSIERKLQNQGTVAKNSLTPNISKRISTKVENAYKEKDDSKYINPSINPSS